MLKLVSNYNPKLSQITSGESGVGFEAPHFTSPEQAPFIEQYEETPIFTETARATSVDPRSVGRFSIEGVIDPEKDAWTPESIRLLQIAKEIQLSRDQHPLLVSELDTTSEDNFIQSVLKKLISF